VLPVLVPSTRIAQFR